MNECIIAVLVVYYFKVVLVLVLVVVVAGVAFWLSTRRHIGLIVHPNPFARHATVSHTEELYSLAHLRRRFVWRRLIVFHLYKVVIIVVVVVVNTFDIIALFVQLGIVVFVVCAKRISS